MTLLKLSPNALNYMHVVIATYTVHALMQRIEIE